MAADEIPKWMQINLFILTLLAVSFFRSSLFPLDECVVIVGFLRLYFSQLAAFFSWIHYYYFWYVRFLIGDFLYKHTTACTIKSCHTLQLFLTIVHSFYEWSVRAFHNMFTVRLLFTIGLFKMCNGFSKLVSPWNIIYFFFHAGVERKTQKDFPLERGCTRNVLNTLFFTSLTLFHKIPSDFNYEDEVMCTSKNQSIINLLCWNERVEEKNISLEYFFVSRFLNEVFRSPWAT